MLVERVEKDRRQRGATASPCKLLIADDQPHILEALRLLLKPEGYRLEMVRMPALVLEALAHGELRWCPDRSELHAGYDFGRGGLELVSRSKRWTPGCPLS